MPLSATTLHAEFDRQVETVLGAEVDRLAGVTAAQITQLRDHVEQLTPAGEQRLPFVLVVPAPPADVLATIHSAGRTGYTDMPADDLSRFRPIDGVEIPSAPAYLLIDVDLGADTRNVTPDDALPGIIAAGRSPLTIDEGLAVLLQHDALATHNAFSL